MEIISQVKARSKAEDLEFSFMIAWSLWYRRNKFLHEDLAQPPQAELEQDISSLKAYQEAHMCLDRTTLPHLGWMKPPPRVLKLNVDGASFKDQHKAGVGIILRDFEGEVIPAISKKELEVIDPDEVGLLAILRGL